MKTLEELGISHAPWSIHTVGSRVFLRDANEKNIAQIYAKLNGGKATPNESLIAAAPNLYDALRGLVRFFAKGGAYDDEREAVAKAIKALTSVDPFGDGGY